MHFNPLPFPGIQNMKPEWFCKSVQAKYHLATHQVSYSHAKSIFIIYSATRKLAMQAQWKWWWNYISGSHYEEKQGPLSRAHWRNKVTLLFSPKLNIYTPALCLCYTHKHFQTVPVLITALLCDKACNISCEREGGGNIRAVAGSHGYIRTSKHF